MKLYKKILLSLFIMSPTIPNLSAMEEWDMNEEFLDDFGAEIENMDHVPTRALAPEDVLGPLIFLKAHNLLKKPFYFYTQPLRRREIVDEVTFNFPRYHLNKNLIVIPFYNQMSAAQFRRDRTGIKNYLDMQQTDLVNTLNELAEDADEVDYDNDGTELDLTNIDIPDLLNMFANMKVQERRLGFMFQYTKDLENSWHISCNVPVLYQEYNYFLTKEEINTIENSAFFKALPPGDYWDFVKKHLLSDKIGFGDLRFSVEQTVKETHAYRLNVGLDITVPSYFAVKKGVIGSYFNKKKATPTFNINDDFLELNQKRTAEDDISYQDQLLQNAEDLALNILDRLSSVLLEHPLGNYRHPGLGFFTRSTLIFSPTVELTSKLRMNLLLPAKERRFIKTKIDPQELNNIYGRYVDANGDLINGGDFSIIDGTIKNGDINRFEAIFLEKFFPESYDVTVMPGLEISSSSQLTYERPKWTIYVGTEMWYHTKESFLKIHTDSTTKSKLEIETAKKEYAYQSKSWIGIDKKKKENSNWKFGVRASASGLNDGIGDDFTISFHCVREF